MCLPCLTFVLPDPQLVSKIGEPGETSHHSDGGQSRLVFVRLFSLCGLGTAALKGLGPTGDLFRPKGQR